MTSDKTFTIQSPNTSFSGVRWGVVFSRGTGEGNEAQARNLALRGYEVDGLDEQNDSGEAGEHAFLRLTGVGKATAEKLLAAGVDSLEELATSDANDVAEHTGLDAAKVEAWQAEACALLGLEEAPTDTTETPDEEQAPREEE